MNKQQDGVKVCRELHQASKRLVDVTKNGQYMFSKNHTLSIYSIDAIYTYIPKNACSTMRYSIAVANGFISNLKDAAWVHSNNRTFIATQKEVARCAYAFIILRCPYRRLVSCFLDKFVGGIFSLANGEELTFHQFCQYVSLQQRAARDAHWRNQSDFLHLKQYDDYFSLENFSKAQDKLLTHGFEVIDTRGAINHDISQLKKVDGKFWNVPIKDLKKMKLQGEVPSLKSFFNKDTFSIVSLTYSDDIILYQEKVNRQDLFKF